MRKWLIVLFILHIANCFYIVSSVCCTYHNGWRNDSLRAADFVEVFSCFINQNPPSPLHTFFVYTVCKLLSRIKLKYFSLNFKQQSINQSIIYFTCQIWPDLTRFERKACLYMEMGRGGRVRMVVGLKTSRCIN